METQSKRIDQLDGLRGIAIILVIINHLRLTPLYALFPQPLQPIFGSLLNSGKIGVCILFFLTGFLMATIHPQVYSKLAFWQKRYTRIFPAFISMCVALTLIRFIWEFLPRYRSPEIAIVIVAGVIIMAGLLWRLLIHLPHRAGLGKIIFFLFVTFQLLTILGYVFVLSRVSSAVFYLVWPKWLQSLIFLAVNSTVALPFGNYVPQLDGAYWSIVTEVFFYILYPLIFLPIVSYIVKQKSYILGALCIILALPFFYGISLLFTRILGFQMLVIYLAIYFAFGVALGLIAHTSFVKTVQSKVRRIPSFGLILLCIIIAVGMPYVRLLFSIPAVFDLLIWVFPITFLMIVTLGENGWVSFLRRKPLMLIGRLSYALYLTHTIAIEMFVIKSGDPKTMSAMTIVALLAIGVMLFLSGLLHYFLEIPYFANKIVTKASIKKHLPQITFSFPKTLIFSTLGLICLIWVAYRIPVSLTSKVTTHHDKNLPSLTMVTTTPIILQFTGQDANLGMILFHIKPLSDNELKELKGNRGKKTEEALMVDLENKQGETLTTNKYPLYQIYDTPFHPVGLPLDPTSKGKLLKVKLYLSNKNVTQAIGLTNTEATFRSVYFYDKKTLLTNPSLLATIIFEKFTQPFMEKAAWMVLVLCGPLIGLLFLRITSVKKQNRKN